MKTYGGVGILTSLEGNSHIHASVDLPHVKVFLYPWDGDWGEPQSPPGCSGEQKNPRRCQELNPGRSASRQD